MPLYIYACIEHGPSEHRFRLGAAPTTVVCPVCQSTARRRITAPALLAPRGARDHALEAQARSSETPGVVTRSQPDSTARDPAPYGGDPRRSRLPLP